MYFLAVYIPAIQLQLAMSFIIESKTSSRRAGGLSVDISVHGRRLYDRIMADRKTADEINQCPPARA